MHPNTRALIAAAAVRLAAGSGNAGAVYDHSRSRYIQISGYARSGIISLHDHDRDCHFVGSGRDFYDQGRGCRISLQMTDTTFSGYDHGVGHHFSGSINGNSVFFHDHGEGLDFNYST